MENNEIVKISDETRKAYNKIDVTSELIPQVPMQHYLVDLLRNELVTNLLLYEIALRLESRP